jgi:GTP1/Obg family GTP-binding protein
MLAANIYVSSGKLDEASALMDKVRNFASGGDNIAQMNNIYLKLGDEMMDKKAYKDALGAYQLVRKKSEISRIQKEQVAKMETQLKTAKGGTQRGTRNEAEGQPGDHGRDREAHGLRRLALLPPGALLL